MLYLILALVLLSLVIFVLIQSLSSTRKKLHLKEAEYVALKNSSQAREHDLQKLQKMLEVLASGTTPQRHNAALELLRELSAKTGASSDGMADAGKPAGKPPLE